MAHISDLKPGDYEVEAPAAMQPAAGFGSAKKLSDLKPTDYEVEAPPPEKPGLMSQAGSAIAKGLDYGGGLVRTGLASVASTAQHAINGEIGNDVTPEDVGNAFKGQAPGSAEYLRRMGVSEGGSVNIPFINKSLTGRGVEGFALDVATDPLTAIAKAVKEIPYIGKIINAPGAASDAVGEAIYKSGLSKVDAKLAEKGVAPVSDELFKAGATGTTAQIQQKAHVLSDAMGKIRDSMYQKADQLGSKVNYAEQGFSNAEAVIAKMKENSALKPAAESFEQMLEGWKKQGPMSLSNASDIKTELYSGMPASSFGPNGKMTAKAIQFKQALAADMREAIVDAGNKAEKGLGDGVSHINDQWGPLIAAKKPLATQASQAAGQKWGDWIDATLIGSGHLGGFLAKKATQLANTTYARTKFGMALSEAGRNGIATGAASRAMIDSQQPDQPPQEEPK